MNVNKVYLTSGVRSKVLDTPFICGGFSGGWQKFCYSLQEYGDWKFESNLTAARGYAANGIVIRKNKLVMSGGTDGWHLSTIEVVATNAKSETLPIKLPMAMSGSCIVPAFKYKPLPHPH